jgi:ornithine carbamoyltransferase
MSPEEASGVVASSRIVCDAAQNGTLGHMLKGRRLALLSDFVGADPAAISGEAQLFVHAATEMGALVARLRPGLSHQSPAQEVQSTARMLGQLYDALECEGMDLGLVQQIALYAGVPVFHGLASAQHRTAALATPSTKPAGAGLAHSEGRRRVVQAVLLGTLA